ncbi:MAG: hypothetical protein K2W95_35870 [Candidatus Obscuribacterales bacterium]|nr:hypothetical protein [Candidatus Obscuribacterales bacterium]
MGDQYVLTRSEELISSAAADPQEGARESLLAECYESTKDFVEKHPVLSAGIACGVAGGIIYFSRARFLGKAANVLDDAARVSGDQAVRSSGAKIMSSTTERSLVNGGLLRDINGKPLPDILRTAASDVSLEAEGAAFKNALESASAAYERDMLKLWALPRSTTAASGDTLQSLASRLISERAVFTGEAISPKLIATELASLQRLNPLLTQGCVVEASTVATYDVHRLTAIASDLRFRHVPQIGKFLGISEKQVAEALEIQMKDKSRLLGDIFIEQKLATPASVEAAFGRQKQLKEALAETHRRFCAGKQ